MKKGKNATTIALIIGILFISPLVKLISQIIGTDISGMAYMCLGIIASVIFIGLAVWVFKQKRYVTVVASLFLSIGFFMIGYGTLIDREIIVVIGDVIFLVSGGVFYFSIIKFNKKHVINR